MENYNVVPSIITGKDLDYLSDIFEWNCLSLKKTNEAIGKVNDDDIKEVLERGYDLFYNNLNLVLNILSEVNTNEQ